MYTASFILLGIFIGICLIACLSIYSYNKCYKQLVEFDTGDVWLLLGKVRNSPENISIVKSTKDGHLEMIQEIKERFEYKG